jgi:hypothetical protein
MNPHSAQYWLQEFVNYAETADWKKGEEPVIAVSFVHYVVKRLIATKCFDELGHFTALLQRLQQKAPHMVPDTTLALVALASAGSLEQQELSWGDMALGARTAFVESVLYQEFLSKRAEHGFEKVKKNKSMKDEDCT